ncbi:hypothetical protein V5738_00905 [Salinisphaera sp. SPP-AMP-43]|uniref:sterol desaturase family protein n=1 Tax=Salinisphaera sp. SPP-AMP-43 TaxID=3121288 RepID=UPI003C6DE11A
MGAIAVRRLSGLLNRWSLPVPGVVGVGGLRLDAVKNGQHLLCHTVYLFGRLHRVHHSDSAIDASTALRMTPGQRVIGMDISLLAVLREPLLLYTHAEFGIGQRMDR